MSLKPFPIWVCMWGAHYTIVSHIFKLLQFLIFLILVGIYCRDVKILVSIEILVNILGLCKACFFHVRILVSGDPVMSVVIPVTVLCVARGWGFFSLCLEYLDFSSHILGPQDLISSCMIEKAQSHRSGITYSSSTRVKDEKAMGILFLVKDRV